MQNIWSYTNYRNIRYATRHYKLIYHVIASFGRKDLQARRQRPISDTLHCLRCALMEDNKNIIISLTSIFFQDESRVWTAASQQL